MKRKLYMAGLCLAAASFVGIPALCGQAEETVKILAAVVFQVADLEETENLEEMAAVRCQIRELLLRITAFRSWAEISGWMRKVTAWTLMEI